MKKVLSALVILAVALTMSFAAAKEKEEKNTKDCRKACQQTFTKCEKDAKGDKVKINECKKAKEECEKNC